MVLVPAGSYNIYIGDIWRHLMDQIDRTSYSKVFVLVDDNTLQFCLPKLYKHISISCEVISVPSGEKQKNLHTCQLIWNQLFLGGADRKSLMIILGGGVLGDMGGWCASLFMRGIPFIQIPTTLLSQVDASVGGKLAIDYNGLKNAIGLFKDPVAVYIDPDFLDTLPRRELLSGYAEVIKHALIQDAVWWKDLKKISHDGFSGQSWGSLIHKAVGIKVSVVIKDPFETSWRKILNFGHTIGHAIESCFLTSPSPLLHGEAIAAGMVIEAKLSTICCGLEETVATEIARYLLRIYSLPSIKEDLFPDLMRIMQQDKKNERRRLLFSLLERAGSAIPDRIVSEEEIIVSLKWYNDLVVSHKPIS